MNRQSEAHSHATGMAPEVPQGGAGRPLFIGSEIYRGSSYGPWHPLRVPRVSQVMDLCRTLGWLDPSVYRTSPRAKPASLALWHTPDYIAALQQAERDQTVTEAVRAQHHLGTAANPIFPEMFRRPATGAGGVFLAAGLLAQGGVVHCPGGGTHHGLPDRANGFCYFNDPVLGILALQARGVTRVAYVDIDAHHCDGVEYAFADRAEVLLISVHEENRWPRTGALSDRGCGNVFNLPVAPGLNDTGMAVILEHLILPRIAEFAPDAIVLQCGADALEEDPMSRLTLSNNAHIAVVRALRPMAPRFLVLGGGGYNPWSVGRLWTRVWAELSGQTLPERLPEGAEAVLRGLSWTGLRRGRATPETWFTTLRDPDRPGPVSPKLRQDLAQLAGHRV